MPSEDACRAHAVRLAGGNDELIRIRIALHASSERDTLRELVARDDRVPVPRSGAVAIGVRLRADVERAAQLQLARNSHADDELVEGAQARGKRIGLLVPDEEIVGEREPVVRSEVDARAECLAAVRLGDVLPAVQRREAARSTSD